MNRWTVKALSVALGVTLSLSSQAVVIEADGNEQETLQEALILAEPGSVIELADGVFEFTMGLSLDVDNVTVRGRGMGQTVLSFKNQDMGSEGLTVTSDGVVLQDFGIEDTVGDAIKVKGADTISFINVRCEWTNGPDETNGAYGLYPVESTNVLVDGCVVVGASDAGIYVGQSKNIVVRDSTAKYNVAGIEIENCYNADVYNNTAIHNTGGILVFDLPNLPQQGGHNVRVFDNQIVDNDTKNFAPAGNIVGYVPTGTGLLIMANKNVEVFDNKFDGNSTGNVMIRSYMSFNDDEAVDPNYYPYPEGIYIHDNRFGTGGYEPMGVRGEMFAKAAGGAPMPDIMWDGRYNKDRKSSGKRDEKTGIYLENNGDADFINIDLENFVKHPEQHKPSRNMRQHSGSMARLPGVKLPQDS